MPSETVLSAARRLARVGLTTTDHFAAQREALAVVREVIPFDAGSFATVDPATVLWTSCVLHGLALDPAREALMFDNEYRQDDLLKIADLALRPEPVGRLSEFDSEIRSRSARYSLLRSYGAGDELRCAIVDQGNCWGSFEIYRVETPGPFTEDDARNAAALSKPIAQLLRIALLQQAASSSIGIEEPPGVMVLSDNGDVQAMTPTCKTWLEDISQDETVPASIRSLAIRATAGNEEALSIVAPRLSGGWLRIHAIPLVSEGRQTVSVILEPARPAVLPETIASVYGFTPRECEVIMWTARGLSSKEIGLQLGISPFTVNDHLKAAFQKAGVQSRQQLIAALFFDHCLPMRERDAIPGPYGWFLEDSRASRSVPA